MRYLPLCDKERRVWHARDGVAALEFAVALPLLMLLMAAVVSIGALKWADMQVENAARAGAVHAQRNGFNATNITNAINAAVASRSDLVISATPAPSKSYGCPNASQGVVLQPAKTPRCAGNADPGEYVTVHTQATYSVLLPVPGVVASQVTLTGKAMARID